MEWLEQIQPDDFEVTVAELLVATADGSDDLIHDSVPEVLKLLRERMGMDVVFVSEFVGDERVFRYVDQPADKQVIAAGASGPLEESWCKAVVEGRMPELVIDSGPMQRSGQIPSTTIPVGTHLSTPIVLGNGEVYGTLCCFSFGVNEHVTGEDLKKLRFTANLAAKKIEQTNRAHTRMSLAPLTGRHAGFSGKL